MKYLLLFLLCTSLLSKDLYPSYIARPRSFVGEALDSFKRVDSLNRAGTPVWKKVYEEGVSYESLTKEEKKLFDHVDGPDSPAEAAQSIYDVSDELYMSNCDDVAYSKNIRATSTLSSSSKYSYEISNISDADLSTAWVEGEEGYGIGTRIFFTPDVTSWVRESYLKDFTTIGFSIHLYNGYVKSPKAWRDNSRVKTALLGVVKGDTIGTLHISDTMGLQFFSIDLPVELLNRECYFEIRDVYRGDKWDDVAVTEFHFHNPGCCVALDTDITMADSSLKKAGDIAVGDSVLTRDKSGAPVAAEVQRIVLTPHDNCYRVAFADTALIITDDHPIRLSDGSWGTLRGGKSPYLKGENAVKLKPGMVLSHRTGDAEIITITRVKETIETFTITQTSRGNLFFANGIEVAVERKE